LELLYTGRLQRGVSASNIEIIGNVALAAVEVSKYCPEPVDVLLGITKQRFAETDEMRKKGIKGIDLILGNDYMDAAGLYITKKGKIVYCGATPLL
jgi:hypothetical protein